MTVSDVIRQIIEQAMFSAAITSANPFHVNRVSSLDINTQDFESIFNDEMKKAIEQYATAEQSTPTKRITEEGMSAIDVLRGAARGVGGPPDIIGTLSKFMPYLAPLMIASGVAMTLFEWARDAGGPLDVRYRRDLQNEQSSFLSRQLQRDTEIGNRQLIIQASANFKNIGGAGSSNTLKQIRDSGDRLADVGLLVYDRAKGMERLS